jgi:hypothetical protein
MSLPMSIFSLPLAVRATCYGEDVSILMSLDIMGHIRGCMSNGDVVFKDLNQENDGYWFWLGSEMMC